MSEVHDVMNLSDAESKGSSSKATFSRDVFRLEISGPDEDHLSVIDVPGIFKHTTPGLTTKEDIAFVRDMVLSYMKNPRSVMLTVIPANVDIATQEILEMARECDPDNNRALGVLTKPDLVDKGAEKRIRELIEGKHSGLKLGWSIVRNPGQQQLEEKATDRDVAEKSFFRDTVPWNSLEKDKVGIEALRIRLQEIQTGHIRNEFPKVKAEVSKKLKAEKNALRALGAERDTPEKQTNYLLDIITEFQEITAQVLATNYSNDLFDDNEQLRLATVLRNRNNVFKEDLTQFGHEYRFATADTESPPSVGLPDKTSSGTKPENDEKKIEAIKVRKTKDWLELEGILHDPELIPSPSDEGIIAWINKLYRTSRGFEIGTFNSSLLATIMKKQSTKWKRLALVYISDVITMIHIFITEVIEKVCPDDRVRSNILSALMDDLIKKYKNAVEQVEFLLNVEKSGTLMALNDELEKNSFKSRQKRANNTTVQYIHNILKSYYEVASKRFIDNVCMQATDYHLVTGPSTPLKLFVPSFVTGLSNEQLEFLAGEDSMLYRKRAQLKREIEELEKGRKILL
ncbi:hypothetical protein ASPWEDRAFT_187956 [Aspergillus wentii DTO 134E9]|uniref:GED domain-containing protein n=1 Tax=Aspergillus wentii DTO 134E9 TaxID=1073089 RepID=A0A1L9R6M5_ASPWE|nr:uncharacterized protein ASPWEDRAFT_187956 [Aspergillus wentii DTO 134E9]OJJ30575.1 hypothetical protein ASPWEDRAFT_187956 [Aspergillus wentii DTO 134E9]